MGIIYLRNEEYHHSTAVRASLNLPEWNIHIRDCILEDGVRLWGNLNLYGCHIEAEVKLANFIEIRSNVSIGAQTKIEPFVFIPEGVRIGKGVFIGPNVSFTNDMYPKACGADGKQLENYPIMETEVGDGASVGAGSVIRCGIRLGKGCLIGAGSTVTNDVPNQTVVYGPKADLKRQLSSQ